MNVRKLLLRIIPLIIFGILCMCILYYSIQYSNLNMNQKFNLEKDWHWLVVGPLIITGILINIRTTLKKYKAFGDIEYRASRLRSKLLVVVLIFISFCFIPLLIDFFSYPSFLSLSEIVIILSGLLYESFRIIIGEGVGHKGIASSGNYYFWDDIKSLNWDKDGGQLMIRFLKKEALIFTEGKVKIRVKEYDKLFVEELLRSYIKKLKDV